MINWKKENNLSRICQSPKSSKSSVLKGRGRTAASISELHSSESLHRSAQKDRGKKRKKSFENRMFILPGLRWKPTFLTACIISFPSQFYTLFMSPGVIWMHRCCSLPWVSFQQKKKKNKQKKTLNVWFFSISLLPHLCGRLIWSQLDNLATDVLQHTKVQSMLHMQQEHAKPKNRESLRHFWSDFKTHLGHQGQLESSSDAGGVKLMNVSRLCGWAWSN